MLGATLLLVVVVVWLRFFRRRQNQMPKMMAARPTTPPTTPPAMAPTGVEESSSFELSEGSDVSEVSVSSKPASGLSDVKGAVATTEGVVKDMVTGSSEVSLALVADADAESSKSTVSEVVSSTY